MIFIGIVIGIVFISFFWALLSLKNLNGRDREIKKASEDLKKGKVIFSSDHSSSGP